VLGLCECGSVLERECVGVCERVGVGSVCVGERECVGVSVGVV
jgi:hypothetical protein